MPSTSNIPMSMEAQQPLRAEVKHIDIGRDFGTHLGPRMRAQGDYSGQKFYEDILRPAYLAADHVVVNLDSIDGYGPSFFEQSFGELVREFGDGVLQRVAFVSERRPQLIRRIEGWMRDARTGLK